MPHSYLVDMFLYQKCRSTNPSPMKARCANLNLNLSTPVLRSEEHLMDPLSGRKKPTLKHLLEKLLNHAVCVFIWGLQLTLYTSVPLCVSKKSTFWA